MSGGDVSGLKIDRGIPSQLERVPEVARAVEREGYDGCWTGEINHDPFLPLALAAEHTSRVELGTSIAVAFARNPMTLANLGWDLQSYSQGRFILGLGTPVKAHIEKRFSMPWSHPAARMREFVLAIRAIWSAWQGGEKLSFEGEFYTHKLMTPMFTPESSAYPFPRVFIAAVGDAMTEMCGEVADGMLAHAFTTRRYLDQVTTPALLRGMARTGRRRAEFELSCPVFIVTGESDADFEAAATAPESRSPSTHQHPPIARSSSCTGGAICIPSCTACLAMAIGTPWARSSTTRCSLRSRLSDRSMNWPAS